MPGSQAGWLRGIVKEVPSGDTVVIVAAVKSGIPPEKRLTLASLIAPKMGRRDGSTRDEPFAWQSREFLRKLCVGKPCVFRVDYALEAAGGREFGTVFINEKQNVAAAVVGAGLARVRPAGGQQSPFHEELLKAAEAAEAAGVGVYTKDRDALAAAVRDSASADFDAAALIQRLGKGRPVQGIVEAVGSGSSLRVTLLPDLATVTVMVAGVQCPSLGRRPAPPAAAGTEGGEGGGAVSEAQPEPFSREAKHFVELRALNRECRLVLEGVSQFGGLVATVLHPTPPPAADVDAPAAPALNDLGLSIVKAGLGRVVDWSANMMTSGAFKLREAERAARQARIGLWHNYVPAPTNSAKLSDKFRGAVSEVVSGDCVVVRDAASGAERRVTLSSIRAPRPAARDRAAEPWAAEGKEFLRQRLIGKEVAVSMDYTRKVAAAPGAGGGERGEERVMSFGSVTIQEGGKEGGEVKVNNVAELLLVRGLAQVVRHRGDEERSAYYEELVAAEEVGKKGKKGQWGNREPTIPRVNDVSTGPNAAGRARQHLPFLQRAGRVAGVCEYVLGGSRIKVHIPKEGVTIAFSPSAVRCPQRGGTGGAGGGAVREEEPYWEEAAAFTRAHVLQRDVELEVESVDKAGTFLGTLRVAGGAKPFNLGVALLSAGLARLHPSFDPARTAGGAELLTAQGKARAAKLKVWEGDKGEEEEEVAADGAGGAAVNGAGGGPPRETIQVVVTDVADANEFYIQIASEERADWIAEQLAGMALDSAPAPSSLLKAGAKCLARFAADKQWYRATVEKADVADPTSPLYDVYFLDFGNRDRVGAPAVRPTPPALAAVPPQAHCAQLAFAPGLSDDYGVEAAQLLSELLSGGRRLEAVVERRERIEAGGGAGRGWGAAAPAKLHLTVLGEAAAADEESDEDKEGGGGDGTSSKPPGGKARSAAAAAAGSTNAKLVGAGLARVVEPGKGQQQPTGAAAEVLEALRAAQGAAKAAHVGVWQYGDPYGDEGDDDGGFPSLPGGAAGKRGRR